MFKNCVAFNFEISTWLRPSYHYHPYTKGSEGGMAVHLDPEFSQLTPQLTLRLLSGTFRGFQLLKLKYDKLLSNFAFNLSGTFSS